MISVIVPIYNAQNTLHRCLDSILGQKYSDYEVLLIDDGSTDDSGKICDEYAIQDKRFKAYHKSNGGVSSARNVGLKYAKGDWITFIDSDDLIENDFFIKEFPPTVDMVLKNWKAIGSDKYMEYLAPECIQKEQITLFLNQNIHLDIFRCPWSKFFRADIINRNHIFFDVRFSIGEDTLFVLNYLRFVRSLQIIDSGCYRYNVVLTENSATRYKQYIGVSLQYIDTFWKSYKKLSYSNNEILKLIYYFYKGKTIDIDKKEVYSKWITNKSVIQILHRLYYRQGLLNQLLYYKLLIKSFLYRMSHGKI